MAVASVLFACALTTSVRAEDPPAATETGEPFSFEQVIAQPAGPPPTPRHTGIKAMAKDLVSDFKHLPSKENLFWAGFQGGSGRSNCVRTRDVVVMWFAAGRAQRLTNLTASMS